MLSRLHHCCMQFTLRFTFIYIALRKAALIQVDGCGLGMLSKQAFSKITSCNTTGPEVPGLRRRLCSTQSSDVFPKTRSSYYHVPSSPVEVPWTMSARPAVCIASMQILISCVSPPVNSYSSFPCSDWGSEVGFAPLLDALSACPLSPLWLLALPNEDASRAPPLPACPTFRTLPFLEASVLCCVLETSS